MPAILTEIVSNKREELKARKAIKDISVLKDNATAGNGSFTRAMAAHSLNLICELKPKSPSAGVLNKSPDIEKILSAYNQFAAAISVLTDYKYFGGSLELLSEIARKSPRPALCKDFIVDPYQCFEARNAGAQAILLIVKILDDKTMLELHDTISSLKMTPVVEVQNEDELARALSLSPQVILINNRNLETFEIDFQTTIDLAPQIPDHIVKISASGISQKREIEQLLPYCSNFLVGSSLMLADDLAVKLQELSSARASRPQIEVH